MKRAAIVMLMCAALLPGACKKKKADDPAKDPAAMKAMVPDMEPTTDDRGMDRAEPRLAEPDRAEPRLAEPPRAEPPRGAMPDSITIKLLDAGKGKKQQLRYKFAAGRTHAMIMDMLMENRIKLGARSMPNNMPKMRYSLSIKVDKGSAAGWSKLHIGGMTITFPEPPQGVQGKAMVAAMSKAKGMFDQMTFTYEISHRGFFKSMTIGMPPDAPPAMKAMMEQIGGSMKQSMMFSSVPLPEEPVGEGAKWTAVVPMNLPMMKFVANMEFVLKKIEGNKVTLDTTMKGRAPKQSMSLPGGKGSMQLDKLDTNARGTMVLDLTTPVPGGDMLVDTAMAGKAGGQTMSMNMKVKITFKAGKGSPRNNLRAQP